MGQPSPRLALAVVALLVACAAPSASPRAGELPAPFASDQPYEPRIDPAAFTTVVDNPYFPLTPGARWVLTGAGDAEGEVDTIEVLSRTRVVMGVECVVVHDVVSLNGEDIEITDDWYAQDAEGNVWYFGEETAEYENGERVSTAGSWEAGVDGAQPGIIMAAVPRAGVTYRQEYFAGEAEDLAKVVETGASVTTPAGSFDGVLVTEDWTPLEPNVRERKSYAPGVGLVMELQVEGGEARFELTEYSGGSGSP